MNAVVMDALPPPVAVRLLNPVMRAVLRSPAGRFVSGIALVRFEGRRTGRAYAIPVGLHEVDGVAHVLTPAGWRVNFRDGHLARVTHRGRDRVLHGVLVSDPSEVAGVVRRILESGTPPRMVGIQMPRGHLLSAADIRTLDRCLIRFEEPGASSAS